MQINIHEIIMEYTLCLHVGFQAYCTKLNVGH